MNTSNYTNISEKEVTASPKASKYNPVRWFKSLNKKQQYTAIGTGVAVAATLTILGIVVAWKVKNKKETSSSTASSSSSSEPKEFRKRDLSHEEPEEADFEEEIQGFDEGDDEFASV